jgi:hypothetical protein
VLFIEVRDVDQRGTELVLIEHYVIFSKNCGKAALMSVLQTFWVRFNLLVSFPSASSIISQARLSSYAVPRCLKADMLLRLRLGLLAWPSAFADDCQTYSSTPQDLLKCLLLFY